MRIYLRRYYIYGYIYLDNVDSKYSVQPRPQRGGPAAARAEDHGGCAGRAAAAEAAGQVLRQPPRGRGRQQGAAHRAGQVSTRGT